MRKLTYPIVMASCKEAGYELLTQEEDYVNTRQCLRVKCECGAELSTCLSNLRKMNGCSRCSKNEQHTYENIKHVIEKAGCKLVSTNTDDLNARTKLDYVCSCGRPAMITVDAFIRGQRCMECGKSKRRGKNHPNYRRSDKFNGSKNPNWNPALSDFERSIRNNRRSRFEYKEWRLAIFRRDYFCCRKCFVKGGNLNAHHIENFSENKDARFELNNGLTLCKKHHDEFHAIYSKKNNNAAQIKGYLQCVIAP